MRERPVYRGERRVASAVRPGPFSATYAGAALEAGMYYQLRVTALDGAGNPLSQTEDLKGVFFRP